MLNRTLIAAASPLAAVGAFAQGNTSVQSAKIYRRKHDAQRRG